ncbi:MAG: hypothetical protein OHK0036_04310 [Bacteroidia bacterium]
MYTGIAIALAWPETLCKCPQSWYDIPMKKLGICKNDYYKVGHAAVVLINAHTGKCFYFDFGRYHTPNGYGRVRDEQTDHDLKIHTHALLNKNLEILNYHKIIEEIANNESCHGTGKIYASYIPINFEKSYIKAKLLQKQSPIKYGPFLWTATNCSRFVRTVILSGNPPSLNKIKIFFPPGISPFPINNVNALKNIISYTPKNSLTSCNFSNLKMPSNIPHNSQWLSGVGAGSWFHIVPYDKNLFCISRYNPAGKLECQSIFKITNHQHFDITQPYIFTYLSHCDMVNILQNNRIIQFSRINHQKDIILSEYNAISSMC